MPPEAHGMAADFGPVASAGEGLTDLWKTQEGSADRKVRSPPAGPGTDETSLFSAGVGDPALRRKHVLSPVHMFGPFVPRMDSSHPMVRLPCSFFVGQGPATPAAAASAQEPKPAN